MILNGSERPLLHSRNAQMDFMTSTCRLSLMSIGLRRMGGRKLRAMMTRLTLQTQITPEESMGHDRNISLKEGVDLGTSTENQARFQVPDNPQPQAQSLMAESIGKSRKISPADRQPHSILWSWAMKHLSPRSLLPPVLKHILTPEAPHQLNPQHTTTSQGFV